MYTVNNKASVELGAALWKVEANQKFIYSVKFSLKFYQAILDLFTELINALPRIHFSSPCIQKY